MQRLTLLSVSSQEGSSTGFHWLPPGPSRMVSSCAFTCLCRSLWGSPAVPLRSLPTQSRSLPSGPAAHFQTVVFSHIANGLFTASTQTSQAPQTSMSSLSSPSSPQPASPPTFPNSENRAALIWAGPVADCIGGHSSPPPPRVTPLPWSHSHRLPVGATGPWPVTERQKCRCHFQASHVCPRPLLLCCFRRGACWEHSAGPRKRRMRDTGSRATPSGRGLGQLTLC